MSHTIHIYTLHQQPEPLAWQTGLIQIFQRLPQCQYYTALIIAWVHFCQLTVAKVLAKRTLA